MKLSLCFVQIDAADKKLRATCEFLEVQATEREQERDEAQKEIETLQEQLRDREKDRASCERIAKEVLVVASCNNLETILKLLLTTNCTSSHVFYSFASRMGRRCTLTVAAIYSTSRLLAL